MSLPVKRPTGRALLVSGAGNRTRALEILRGLSFAATELDDPYAAMTELCRRPLVYRAVILSLASLYREELAIVSAVKSRFPHVEVWLAHTDGRQAVLAEAMRLGADGLLAEDGLHRVAGHLPASPEPVAAPLAPPGWPELSPRLVERPAVVHSDNEAPPADHEHDLNEELDIGPLLTPDELRALLQEQSPVPPDED